LITAGTQCRARCPSRLYKNWFTYIAVVFAGSGLLYNNLKCDTMV
jgi:hypothetical protein